MNNTKNLILELRASGMSYRAIQKKLNCSKGLISYYCTSIPSNSDTIALNAQARRKPFQFPEALFPVIDMLLEEGVSRKAISKTYDVPYSEIQRYVRLNNVPVKKTSITEPERTRTFRRNRKLLAVTFKGGCCEVCGYNKCIAALEFHHLDPSEKEVSISTTNVAWSIVLAELEKCVLLCANCHREAHNMAATEGIEPSVSY